MLTGCVEGVEGVEGSYVGWVVMFVCGVEGIHICRDRDHVTKTFLESVDFIISVIAITSIYRHVPCPA
jgi:hypothetical protein